MSLRRVCGEIVLALMCMKFLIFTINLVPHTAIEQPESITLHTCFYAPLECSPPMSEYTIVYLHGHVVGAHPPHITESSCAYYVNMYTDKVIASCTFGLQLRCANVSRTYLCYGDEFVIPSPSSQNWTMSGVSIDHTNRLISVSGDGFPLLHQ